MRSLILALLLVSSAAARTAFHVSPTGSDRASGRSSLNKGSEGPFKTLSFGLEAGRKARADGEKDVQIVLHGGRFELDAPIELTERDSGTPDHPLLISAADNEKPILSGGRAIQNWKRDDSNPQLWTTQIPEVRAGRWNFHELFVNGERKVRARTPNRGEYFRIQGESPQQKAAKFEFKEGEIKKSWASGGQVEVIALLAWADFRLPLREVDESNHVALLSGEARPSNKESNARYWLENSREFLDSPGEWFLDRRTGTVSYLAGKNENLAAEEVTAPLLEDLLVLRGNSDAQKTVHDIRISGIEFAHTDWALPENGYADTQAAVAVRGDIRMEYAERISIERCKFAHLAGYGIDLGAGCKNIEIIRNDFSDLGGGGIRIGETHRPKNAFEENNTHLITDNHLHGLGRVYAPAVGIFIMHSGTNRVAHNEIHDLYYTAVSVGWNWGYQETPCRENVVEFNHMYNIGQDMLSDMGAVYTLGIQHGTVVRNNLIHDVSSFTYGGWGLYTDEGSTGILLESNVVYHCKSAGFHQHYGRENVIRNNIFALNRESQLMRTRPEPHISFIFTNNIVYFDSGELLGSNWSNDNYKMDYNIYFDRRPASDPAKLTFAGGTFEQWKQRGHDLHSVIADPKFVAAEKFDFALQPDSPALALGFHPIDLRTVGVRKEPARPR